MYSRKLFDYNFKQAQQRAGLREDQLPQGKVQRRKVHHVKVLEQTANAMRQGKKWDKKKEFM